VSYTLVQKLFALLNNASFNVIIADESHYLKNIKTQRSQCLLPLLKKSKRAILLSGTPALSRPMELFTQLHVLAPHIWPDDKEYAKRYCRSAKGKYWSDYRGASNTKELHVMLSNTVMIRRLKKDVMSKLPSKQRSLIHLRVMDENKLEGFRNSLATIKVHDELISTSTTERSKRLKSSESLFTSKFSEGPDLESLRETKKSCLLELFSASGLAKVPAFLEHLGEFLDDR
jgi:SWI/SNF-related matrix-associated actin-dependent regulator 1 of chromatin subfamily A